jgi:hypothetical protein
MTAETIFSMIVAVICMLPIFIIGIVQYKSEEPVGFWSGKKPPKKEQITDVTAYNHKHGMMWILYGAGFLFCFCIGMLFDAVIASIAACVECFGGLALMVFYHNKLDRTYLKVK